MKFHARARAKEFEERTKLEIVYINRGARTSNGSFRRRFRTYWKTARRLGFNSVTQRFARDDVFQRQMKAQGWTINTIMNIDYGANAAARVGRRSRSEIEKSGRYVYRGKQFAADDETWDKAHLYSCDQVSEYRHWDRAKKGRGGVSSQTSYPSSSWSSSRWHEGR